MKLIDIKKLLPEFKDFSLYKQYGISKKCCIEGYNITKPYKIHARCGTDDNYFEYSESGYAEAIKWLEEKRLLWLKRLGVQFKELKEQE